MRQHQGYFERASGGTLFLDEITEMPIDLQAKLLRVLESGRMVRVGGTEEIADRRPHRDGDQSPVGRGRSRPALARGPLLSARRLRRPPAAAAPAAATISSCWPTHFLAQLNQDIRDGEAVRSPPRLAGATTHSWPGNVRELKNCVERSYVLSDDVVRLDVQPALDVSDHGADSATACACRSASTMADAERELLLATLRHCRGNKRRTADVLGVSLKTVYNKLVGYGNVDARCCEAAGERLAGCRSLNAGELRIG